MENAAKTMSTKELSQAVNLLVEREEARTQQQRLRTRRKIRRRRAQMEASVAHLTHSIEVIKWCIVGITTVMAVSLIILILVVMEVEREADRIKGEVQKIQREAELIRDKIRHPLETIGAGLGRRLEGNIGGFLGTDDRSDVAE